MPIGKDSIKTRVAKVSAPEAVEAPAAEVKAPAKKPATKKAAAPKAEAKKPATTKVAAPKKPAAKKPAAPKAPKAETPAVETAVLANVAPETVAAVIGHDEKKAADKVKIGQKLPTHLL